ncbi:hypothetical protein EVAR_69437_1 [Eumeta japonica]|uniref:Uncharacterized protein n=1 Tax=Eumeta variegata TaxID=151549 RepID=A0A4C2ABI1_EUMVA|nr:hypothetical protein EVAR_69437_1 [Eumeta japonica]
MNVADGRRLSMAVRAVRAVRRDYLRGHLSPAVGIERWKGKNRDRAPPTLMCTIQIIVWLMCTDNHLAAMKLTLCRGDQELHISDVSSSMRLCKHTTSIYGSGTVVNVSVTVKCGVTSRGWCSFNKRESLNASPVLTTRCWRATGANTESRGAQGALRPAVAYATPKRELKDDNV